MTTTRLVTPVVIRLRNTHLRQWLPTNIEHAFRGVQLGDGMTIYAGESLDRYGDQNEVGLSANAERIDWRRIPSGDLHQRAAAIGYLDAAGLRFYTPAIMSTILRDEDGLGNMTDSWFWTLHDFRKNCNVRDVPYCVLYNRSQRAAILRFVKFQIFNTRYGRSDEPLLKTLDGLRR